MYEHSDCMLCSTGGAGGDIEGGGATDGSGSGDGDAGVAGTTLGNLKPLKILGAGGVKAGGASGVLTGIPKTMGDAVVATPGLSFGF